MEARILERADHPVSRRDIDSNVLKVLYRLVNSGHVAYLVGGSVRDLMLGRRPKDFDVATSAHPHEVRELFRNSRQIGRRFKLIHVFFGPQNIEVATFRRRSEAEPLDGDPLILQDNTFGTPEEDALRRDFTVNSLFYDPRTFRVIDYAGGLEDLASGLIRTVGEPEVRMREDPVRMIRAVRFAAKLDFTIEPATREAIAHHRADLLKASTPRLVEEIFRTFTNAPPQRALLLMAELGLLEVVLPFLDSHLVRDAADVATAVSDLGQTSTARTLAALQAAIEGGLEPSRALTLACLLSDLYLSGLSGRPAAATPDLGAELRERGFPRGEVERARLLLGAVRRMSHPNRRLRGLSQRPYYEEAKTLYALIAEHHVEPPPPRPSAQPARDGSRRRRRPRRGRHGAAGKAPAGQVSASQDSAPRGGLSLEAAGGSEEPASSNSGGHRPV